MAKKITCTHCDKVIAFRAEDIVRAHKCFILCPHCNHANTDATIDLAVEKAFRSPIETGSRRFT